MRAKEFLKELNMSPSRLMQFAKSEIGQKMQAGFEVECIVPGDGGDDGYGESEMDFDYDSTIPRHIDWDDIRDFFQIGRMDQRALRNITDEFEEYQMEQQGEYVESHVDEYVETIKENNPDLDDESIMEMAQEACDEYYWQNDAPELYDFFKANDVSTWSDMMESYNLEWPYFTDPSNNDDYERYADLLQDVVKQRVRGSNDYHSGRQPDTWYVEPDGSIEPDDNNTMGIEIISPPMPVLQMLDKLEKVLDFVRYENGYTNESTGLHIGVSMEGTHSSNLDYVKLALFLGDEYVLDQFRRLSNSYCKSAIGKIESKTIQMQDNPESLEMYLNDLRAGLSSEVGKTIMSSNSDKYTSINVHEGYVEFRSMGGNYLEELPKIKNMVLRYIQAYAVAIDPEAEKKEYLKKLSAIMNPNKMDMIAPFVSYTAGQLNKADLIRMVKTLRHEQLAARQTAERNAKHAQYLQHGDQGLPNPNMRMPPPAPSGQWGRWFVTPSNGGPTQALSARSQVEAMMLAREQFPAIFAGGIESATPESGSRPPAHVTNRMSPGELRLSDFATAYATNPDIRGTGE